MTRVSRFHLDEVVVVQTLHLMLLYLQQQQQCKQSQYQHAAGGCGRPRPVRSEPCMKVHSHRRIRCAQRTHLRPQFTISLFSLLHCMKQKYKMEDECENIQRLTHYGKLESYNNNCKNEVKRRWLTIEQLGFLSEPKNLRKLHANERMRAK